MNTVGSYCIFETIITILETMIFETMITILSRDNYHVITIT
jgi:hypothetical protein